MNAVQTKTKISKYSLWLTSPLLLLVFTLVSTQSVYAATPTTAQIRDTIKAKCNTVLTKDNNKKNNKKADYRLLTQACKGTGAYKENAAKKAQRAQRLLDICQHDRYLRPANAYNSVGVVNGGDCAAIVSNNDLVRLTRNLKNYPAGTFGQADDPALDCKPNQGSNGATVSNKCDLVKKYIDPFIAFLSALVGIGVIIGIISGGIRYTTSGDDPQKVAAARNQIRGAIVALLAYIFLWAFIQWALP